MVWYTLDSNPDPGLNGTVATALTKSAVRVHTTAALESCSFNRYLH
jgi:hypothetical protein